MPGPLLSDNLPDRVAEMAFMLCERDCGDENRGSCATAPEVKVASTVELQAMEGFLIVALNADRQVCFIEVLHRHDVKYLLEEHYPAK